MIVGASGRNLEQSCQRFELPRPSSQEELQVWKRALGPLARRLNVADGSTIKQHLARYLELGIPPTKTS